MNKQLQEGFNAIEQAMRARACAEGVTAIHNTHGAVQKLVAMYFYYIVDCTRKDFPSLPLLRNHYAEAVRPYGWYVDYEGEVVAAKNMCFAGNSKVTTTTSQYNIHQCYVRHNSELRVCLTDHSHVFIDAFEDSRVQVEALSPTCKCTIRQYGRAKVAVLGHIERVQVKLTNKETY